MHPVLQIYCQKTAGANTPSYADAWNALGRDWMHPLSSRSILSPETWYGFTLGDYDHRMGPTKGTTELQDAKNQRQLYGGSWNANIPDAASWTAQAGRAAAQVARPATQVALDTVKQRVGEFAGKAAPWAAGITGLALLIYMMSQRQQPTGGGTQMSMQPTGWGPQLPALGMGAYTMNQQQRPPVNQPVMQPMQPTGWKLQPTGWEPQLPKEDTRAYR